jgi:hypothetical protein
MKYLRVPTVNILSWVWAQCVTVLTPIGNQRLIQCNDYGQQPSGQKHLITPNDLWTSCMEKGHSLLLIGSCLSPSWGMILRWLVTPMLNCQCVMPRIVSCMFASCECWQCVTCTSVDIEMAIIRPPFAHIVIQKVSSLWIVMFVFTFVS